MAMDSFVKSPQNQNYTVEQLSSYSSVFNIVNTQQKYNPAYVKFKLNPDRVYYIDRMVITMDLFRNTVLPAYAFPKYEEFALELIIDGDLGDVNIKQNPLFKQMAWGTSDGITNHRLFCEPFMFNSSNSLKPYLWLTFNDNGSTIISLTNIPIPPFGNQVVEFMALITLEGVSYPATLLGSSI